MDKKSSIIWNDKNTEKLFAGLTLDDFLAFSDDHSESQLPVKIKTTIMREHSDKKTGEVNRRMTRVEVAGSIFFLKKARGRAFVNIKNEYEAINVLPDFNFSAPEILAYSMDEEKLQGFVLLKELSGYYSIQELITGYASESAVSDFIARKEEILTGVAERMRVVHQSGYTYPDLFAKHIYIKQGSDDIVLIDLERFRPLNKCPWYFGFPVSSYFVKQKCWKKCRRSLKSEILPNELLKKLLRG